MIVCRTFTFELQDRQFPRMKSSNAGLGCGQTQRESNPARFTPR
jgi:hypothetical protein